MIQFDRCGPTNLLLFFAQFLLTLIILLILVGWIWRRESQWHQVQDITDSVLELKKATEHMQYGLIKHEAKSEQQLVDRLADLACKKVMHQVGEADFNLKNGAKK